MDIFEIIKSRRSVRSFDGSALSDAQACEIDKAIAGAEAPFGGKVAISFAQIDGARDFRPSTYGVIRGARAFMMLAAGADRASYLSAGFMMERIVLRLTEMGLGTCWISGTFRGKTFESKARVPEGTSLIAVVAVGRPADKKSFVEKVMRRVAGCDSRKPFGELFFMNIFYTPYPADGPFVRALEAVRLAPSAVNAQPWRAVVRDGSVDFYCAGKGLDKWLDMGIALCHFAEVCKAQGETGAFVVNEMPAPGPEGTQYVISFIS